MSESSEKCSWPFSRAHGVLSKTQRYSIYTDIKQEEAACFHMWEAGTRDFSLTDD